jgi:hypothetical protein
MENSGKNIRRMRVCIMTIKCKVHEPDAKITAGSKKGNAGSVVRKRGQNKRASQQRPVSTQSDFINPEKVLCNSWLLMFF